MKTEDKEKNKIKYLANIRRMIIVFFKTSIEPLRNKLKTSYIIFNFSKIPKKMFC